MKVVHDWLQEYVGDDLPSAEEVERLLTFHAFEIEGVETVGATQVIDVDVLPNRGADCLSHRGIAREIATLIDRPLAYDPFVEKPKMPETDKLKITIADSQACRHFDLALVTGVTVEESPEWLKRRLAAIGQRSINNVVDATNYVMFSLGQPTHAFDADKLTASADGQLHISVRFGKKGESLTLLSGEEIESDESILHLVDGNSETLLDIAAIKGGAAAELTNATANIVVSGGNFDPSLVRKTSQKLRLQTDASKRFENGISTNVVPYALSEVVQLIVDIAGGELQGYAHARPVEMENQSVPVSLTEINNLLGVAITEDEVEDIFGRLGFVTTRSNDQHGVVWKVTAPFERTDINIAADVIEEVGRVYGYEHIASVPPEPVPLAEYNHRHYYSERVRDILVELGFSEVITSSFRKKDEIQLQNALASDKSCLRSALRQNISEALDRNAPLADLLGTPDTRLFEIGTVFEKGSAGIVEHLSLCLGVRVRPSGYSGKEDKLLNTALTALETQLGTTLSPTVEKGVAEINFSKLLQELPSISAYEPVPTPTPVTYQPFSTFPFIARDVALWVTEGTTAADVEAVLNEHAGALRVRTTLFDEFTKDGRTSYAFRLVFQAADRTLTDAEVNEVMEQVYQAITERGWEVR